MAVAGYSGGSKETGYDGGGNQVWLAWRRYGIAAATGYDGDGIGALGYGGGTATAWQPIRTASGSEKIIL